MGVAALALLAGCSSGADRATSGGSTTTTTTTTTTAVAATTAAGDEFRDPQGVYTMTVPRGWTRLPGVIAQEIEAWSVAQMVDGFGPNVNVLHQEFLGATPSEYIEYSEGGGEAITIDSASIVTLAPGVDGARMLMSQSIDDQSVLKSLAIAVTRHNTAVLATLTAPEAHFDRLVRQVEPFLRTLRFAAP